MYEGINFLEEDIAKLFQIILSYSRVVATIELQKWTSFCRKIMYRLIHNYLLLNASQLAS